MKKYLEKTLSATEGCCWLQDLCEQGTGWRSRWAARLLSALHGTPPTAALAPLRLPAGAAAEHISLSLLSLLPMAHETLLLL